MKKTLLILAALLCGCFALKAQEQFTSDGLNYRVTGTTPPTVTLTGHTDGESFAAHDFVIPSTVTYDGTIYSVTSIGNDAFAYCINLTGSLTIPNSVTSIGSWAFDYCLNLTGSLTIPNSVTSIGGGAFKECSGFNGTLTIGSSVTSIGTFAFYRCKNLTGSLTIPNSVTSIGASAFEECSGFNGTLTIGSSVTSIKDKAFKNSGFTGSLIIPNSVESIGKNAFEVCLGFSGSLTIGNSVTSIGQYAFNVCYGFSGSLTIGSSVTSIGESAFYLCEFADIISKPTTPPDLGPDALGHMTSLETVIVPCGSSGSYKSKDGWNVFVNKIAEDFIQYDLTVVSANTELGTASITQTATCKNQQVTVTATPVAPHHFAYWTENGVQVSTDNPYTFTLESDRHLVANFFSQYDFSAICSTGQTLYYRITDEEQHLVSIVAPNNDVNYLCWDGYTKPTGDIELPETVTNNRTTYTVTEINSYAFYRCDGLTGSLVIPNSVTSIGNDAFYNCTGFNGSLTIGNAVTNIGNNAFNQCSGFTGSLDIPNSVTSIGNNAFKKCEGFTGSLTIPNSVTSIGQQAFENCKGFNGSLTIGNAVTSIGATAFNGCTNFTGTLTIGSSVTSIENYAFFNCSGFTHIIAKPTTPPTLGTDVFEGVTGVQSVTVPCENIQEYKQASNWNTFASMIKGGSFEYELTVASSNPQMGTASITQYSDCTTGLSTIVATPTTHNRFANWTENGLLVSTENPYTFELTSDRDLVANFFRQYDFSAICSTGQTLYYRIIDAEHHWVSIVAPNSDDWHGWDDYTKPAGDITLPETVEYNGTNYTATAIGKWAFYGCNGLTGSLTIPNSVTSIGVSAFDNCSGFTGTLTIPNSVTSIGDGAFWNCHGFTGSLTIPNSVTSIGRDAFFGCYGFTGTLTIGSSVNSIEEQAFFHCIRLAEVINLSSLNIEKGSRDYGDAAYYALEVKTSGPSELVNYGDFVFFPLEGTNYLIGYTGSSTQLTLPASYNGENYVISHGAFYYRGDLMGTLTIPETVTGIGKLAFYECEGFTGSLTIPNSVKSIEYAAFMLCTGLCGSLTIGSSVESIEEDAFWNCNFTNIISKAQNAPILTSKIPDATHKVYIPKNTTNSYQNAWSGHGYIFIEYDSEDYHFNGTTDNNWSTAANWEEGELPAQNCPSVFINADCQVNTNAEVGVVNVAAGKTLTVNENCTLTADCIILEEGAQLVNNGTVSSSNLTVKKDIEGYGSGTGGWYLVSSPVSTIGIPSSMRANPKEDYDLYRFEQNGADGNEWINAKAVEGQGIDFYLEALSGYLYANKNNTTIVFRGGFAATGAKTLEYVEGVDFPGFNLVGNPYPCNATISGENLRSSNYYYKMNANGTNLEVVANPVLAPCTGVFAVAANDQATVTFTPTTANANVTRGEKSSLQDIRVELLANGKVIDRAILNTNGESLPKFRLNDNSSEICFYQNKEELAVASTDATRGEMPLNFKAEKNGSYTISVNVGDVDLNYLHLVDNLTGNDVDLLGDGTGKDAPWRVSTYSFEAKTNDYASRFKLVFGVKGDTFAGSESNFAFISNGEIIVSNEGRATLQLIDVMGRIVSSEEINGEARISTNGLTAGMYVLNLNGMTQKIVVR